MFFFQGMQEVDQRVFLQCRSGPALSEGGRLRVAASSLLNTSGRVSQRQRSWRPFLNHFGRVLIFLVSLAPFWSQAAEMKDPQAVALINHVFVSTEDAVRSVRAMGLELKSKGDHRALFPLIYALTIESAEKKLADHEFRNPRWTTTLIINYANLYRRTILQELSGHRAATPKAWQFEFNFAAPMPDATGVTASQSLAWSPDFDAVYGINVHIARDLIEALFITPTDFSDENVHQDYLLITAALANVMPQIWSLFSSFSDVHYSLSNISQAVMMNWIGELRIQAWSRASQASHSSIEQKRSLLNQVDTEVAFRSRVYGTMLPLMPIFN